MISLVLFVLAVINIAHCLRTGSTNSTVLPYEQWAGKRLLFMHAHTDDMECASGGLITRLKGVAEVFVVIMTNGDKGCSNDAVCGNSTSPEIAAIRQTEQLNSAAVLGIPAANVIFLSYEDCQLNSYPEGDVQRELVGLVRRIQPHIVFTWDPAPRFELTPSDGWGDIGYHPDHQSSGKRTLDAVWTAHLDRLWPELGPGWKAEQLYFWNFTPDRVPDYFVDTTPKEVFDTKVAAFLQMHSQYTDPAEIYDMLEDFGRSVARSVGLPPGSRAEGYNYVLW